MESKDVFFYLVVMIGTFIIGSIIGLVLLLVSYAIMTALLNLDLVPKDSLFYGAILAWIGAVKTIMGRLIGGLY